MKKSKRMMWTVTAILAVAVLICAGFIMYNGFGLVDDYDFGAGAYYYADIPAFDKILNEDTFQSKFPLWVHISIFLLWGWLMYRLWCWIDRIN